jgi:pimeloyl-ACP methyl ester carboxylesterase
MPSSDPVQLLLRPKKLGGGATALRSIRHIATWRSGDYVVLSDRVAEQTLEERVGDERAVMDAAGSERATIYGWSEGGPMCLMFAATCPARVSALVLFGTFALMKNEPSTLGPPV